MATPRARILVVDDDDGLLILMAEVLRDAGWEVDTAGSAVAAVDYLRRSPPDLLVLDLKLADAAGPELIARIRAVDDSVPFIVVTGQGDERVAVEIMKQGALDYLMKDTALLDLLPEIVSRAHTAVERERALALAGEERRQLERKVVEEGERQQRRIGADLHDGLGQQLTAIELMCASLKGDLANAQPDLVPQLERIGAMLRTAIAHTRAISRGLVPVRDEPEALWESLTELADVTDGLGRLSCRFECPSPVLFSDRTVAGHLYRIAQEAVNNAVKHSGAREIVISLAPTPTGGAILTIADDGQGLSTRATPGVGLQVMQHRASVIGADLTVEPAPDHGVTVTCTLPGAALAPAAAKPSA